MRMNGIACRNDGLRLLPPRLKSSTGWGWLFYSRFGPGGKPTGHPRDSSVRLPIGGLAHASPPEMDPPTAETPPISSGFAQDDSGGGVSKLKKQESP